MEVESKNVGKMSKTKKLLRKWIAGSSNADDVADELRRRTGYRLRTSSSSARIVREWVKTRHISAKDRLRMETGYSVGSRSNCGLDVSVRKWVKRADKEAARDVTSTSGYCVSRSNKNKTESISTIVRRAIKSGYSRDLTKRTGYVLRKTNTTISESVRRYVAGEECATEEIARGTGYVLSRSEKEDNTSTFDHVRQYITGTSGSEKHIHRRTGYVLSRRKTSLLLDRVRRYARGGSEKDIVELTGYVLPSKGQTDSVIELVRRAVCKKRSIFMDELEKRTGYRMRASVSRKGGAEDLKSFWGVVKSNSSPRTVAKAATVASMALQSNAVSSSTILSTLEKSFSTDLEASFGDKNNTSSRSVPDVKILLKRSGEMREMISNLSSEQTHKEVQVRVEPIIHAQDDAVRNCSKRCFKKVIFDTRTNNNRYDPYLRCRNSRVS